MTRSCSSSTRKAPDRHRPDRRIERDARRPGGGRTGRGPPPRRAPLPAPREPPADTAGVGLSGAERPAANRASLPASTHSERRLAELGVLVVMVFWAGNFIVVKGAIGVLPPVGFTFLRYCIAAITLLILLRWREGAIRLPRGDTLKIFGLGIVGFGCYQILWPVALQSIPAGDSALLIAATPVMTALLAMAVGADTPNAVKLIGAFVS